jgi:hypothetical protein
MNNQLKRTWKLSWPYLRYYPSIFLEGLRKTIQNLNKGSHYLSKIRTWKYKAGTSPTWPQLSVFMFTKARAVILNITSSEKAVK